MIPAGFKPMLAGKAPANLAELKFPLLASTKLDGIRVIIFGGVVYSRNLKPIPNRRVQRVFGRKKYDGFDGELTVGDPCSPEVYRATSSGVMSVEGEPDVTLWVFDWVLKPELPFSKRFDVAANLILQHQCRAHANAAGADLALVTQARIEDADHLEYLEQNWLEEGYEGAMLRDPAARYKYGRSTAKEGGLLKLKRFEDGEAIVTGYEELMRNGNAATKDELGRTKRSTHKAGKVGAGMLGALCVQDVVTGALFNIGSGFDAATRAHLWTGRDALAGRIVKYRYFPTGNKEAPRFPTYLGFRHPIDL